MKNESYIDPFGRIPTPPEPPKDRIHRLFKKTVPPLSMEEDQRHDGRWIGPLTFFMMIIGLLAALTVGLSYMFS